MDEERRLRRVLDRAAHRDGLEERSGVAPRLGPHPLELAGDVALGDGVAARPREAPFEQVVREETDAAGDPRGAHGAGIDRRGGRGATSGLGGSIAATGAKTGGDGG
jgi:hypothetical protein